MRHALALSRASSPTAERDTTPSAVMAASRVVLITGASRGIGLALAKELAARPNTTVVAACRNEKSMAAARAALPGAPLCDFSPLHKSNVRYVKIDCGDSKSRQAALKEISDVVGEMGIDVFVNNAGILHNGWTQEEWDATMATNVYGPIELTQTLLPAIRDGGRVVNVSSGLGQLSLLGGSPLRQAIEGAQSIDEILRLASPSGFPAADSHMSSMSESAPYKVSKALLNRATRLLAADPEVTRRGIKVNAVSPGWVRTDMGGSNAAHPESEGVARILQVVDDTEGRTGNYFSRPAGWTDKYW